MITQLKQMIPVGTRSLLFGVHQVFIHPWVVAIAWIKLYGWPKEWQIWLAFLIHDWGYWGCQEMDGEDGEQHPKFAANLMFKIVVDIEFFKLRSFRKPIAWIDASKASDKAQEWYEFCLYHSRHFAKQAGTKPSRLCVADKLATAVEPAWMYVPRAWITGELAQYRQVHVNRISANGQINDSERALLLYGNHWQWKWALSNYLSRWALAHKEDQSDNWTPTKEEVRLKTEAE